MQILLVDDSVTLLKVLKKTLSNAKHTVDTAYDGLELVSLYKKQPYNLIVTDNYMTTLDGIDALEQIKSSLWINHTAVIMTSSSPDATLLAKLKQFPIIDFLLKPLDITRLQEHVVKVGAKGTPELTEPVVRSKYSIPTESLNLSKPVAQLTLTIADYDVSQQSKVTLRLFGALYYENRFDVKAIMDVIKSVDSSVVIFDLDSIFEVTPFLCEVLVSFHAWLDVREKQAYIYCSSLAVKSKLVENGIFNTFPEVTTVIKPRF